MMLLQKLLLGSEWLAGGCVLFAVFLPHMEGAIMAATLHIFFAQSSEFDEWTDVHKIVTAHAPRKLATKRII